MGITFLVIGFLLFLFWISEIRYLSRNSSRLSESSMKFFYQNAKEMKMISITLIVFGIGLAIYESNEASIDEVTVVDMQ